MTIVRLVLGFLGTVDQTSVLHHDECTNGTWITNYVNIMNTYRSMMIHVILEPTKLPSTLQFLRICRPRSISPGSVLLGITSTFHYGDTCMAGNNCQYCCKKSPSSSMMAIFRRHHCQVRNPGHTKCTASGRHMFGNLKCCRLGNHHSPPATTSWS